MKTFLLADDGEDDVILMRRAFAKNNISFPLHVAANGEEALHYLAGNGKFSDRKVYPFPSVLLLDINMPRLNGFEVLTWIRNSPICQHLPVIIMSSSSLEEDVKRALALGATSYLVKPRGSESFDQWVPTITKYWMEMDYRKI